MFFTYKPEGWPRQRLDIRSMPLWGIVVFYLALCFVRAPVIFAGRFWAEEGIYFALFRSHGLFENLFTGPGYPMALTNIAVLFSLTVPLQWAPLITTYIGLAAQFLLVVLVALWCERAGFDRINTVLIVALVAVLPHSAELLANATNLQWLFAAIALMIMLDRGAISTWLACALLILAGLSGLASTLLLPAFALKFLLDRSRGNALQLISLGIATAAIVFIGLRYSTQLPKRVYPLDPILYVKAISIQGVVSPLIGFATAARLGNWYLLSKDALTTALVATTLSLAIFALFLIGLWRQALRHNLVLLGLAYWTSVIVGIFGALEPTNLIPWPVGRYFFVPNLILLLLIGMLSATRQRLAAAVYSCLFLIHLWPDPAIQKTFFEGPSWRSELARTDMGRNDRIKIWPDGWAMNIK